MTFLPIVERELRVAARKRSTFWLRVAAALVALIIAGGFLITARAGAFPLGPSSFGKGLFAVLTWLSLGLALSAGLFFTSDCLSEEKREGTLGFLFLTDLRGYDVVFGKLLATSLRAICALLAVFPILGITLLMGGVTGSQFWRTILALINALFISLAAGMFVSAISRDPQKALSVTLLLLLLLAGGGPILDVIFGPGGGFQPVFSSSSPAYLFVAAGAWAQPPIGLALLANQFVGWILIGLTCLVLPRAWQERARRQSAVATSLNSLPTQRAKQRDAMRTRLLTPNPILWLACRYRWQRIPVWIVAVLLAGGSASLLGSGFSLGWLMWSYLASALTLVLYLSVASHAGRFFVESQRTGFLELLLVTPVTVKQLIEGQWRALVRLFLVPVFLCVLAQATGSYMFHRAQTSLMAARSPPPTTAPTKSTTTNITVITTTGASGRITTVSVGPLGASSDLLSMAISGVGTLTFLANICALTWFGMWMGLTSRNTNMATLKTITFVQIIPWFVITFASGMIIPLVLLPKLMSSASSVSSQTMVWYSLLTSIVGLLLALGKDVGFIFIARQRLYSEFRERALHVMSPIRMAPPPPLPKMEAPPVIGTG